MNEKNNEDVVSKIKSILNTRIRPAVAQDGGDIVFKKYEDGILYVKMEGACSGCPHAVITLKNGVEKTLKHYIPELIAVKEVD